MPLSDHVNPLSPTLVSHSSRYGKNTSVNHWRIHSSTYIYEIMSGEIEEMGGG